MSHNKINIKRILKYDYKSNEQIDQDFVEAFGKDALEDFELSYKLKKLIIYLAQELDIEPVFVALDIIEADSQLYFGDNISGPYIIVNNKFRYNELEIIKLVIHETRHYYQYQVLLNDLEYPLKHIWKEELQTNSISHPSSNEELKDYMCYSYEIDALAYTKYIMKKLFYEEIIYGDYLYDKFLEAYILKYLL